MNPGTSPPPAAAAVAEGQEEAGNIKSKSALAALDGF
jgi:hypothetical protein